MGRAGGDHRGGLDPARVRALVLVAALVPEPGRPYLDRLRAERDLMVSGHDAGVQRGTGASTYWPDAVTALTGLYRGVADELASAHRAGHDGADGRPGDGHAGELRRQDGAANGPVGGPVAGRRRAGDPLAAAVADLRPQDWSLLREPCPLTAWPAVRTVSVICADDRVVDPRGSRREAARVGAEVVELPGGHFPMLTRPDELTGLLAGLATGERFRPGH